MSLLKSCALSFLFFSKLFSDSPTNPFYLTLQSALPTPEHQWTVSQKELLLTQVHFSPSTNHELEWGALLPLLYLSETLHAHSSYSYKKSFHKHYHGALGLKTQFGNSLFNLQPHLIFTYGVPIANLSLQYQHHFRWTRYKYSSGPTLQLSGHYQLWPFFALVSENHFTLESSETFSYQSIRRTYQLPSSAIYTFATRWIFGKFSMQTGILTYSRSVVYLPWLDFSYQF